MHNDFEILRWDSDFFKFKVAKINIGTLLNRNLLKQLNNNNIHLAYYSSLIQLDNLFNEFYSIELVDIKVSFLKEIEKVPTISHTEYYIRKHPNNQLINLALESGEYSRFNRDQKIGRKKYEELYTQWITKSVSKEIADEVIVCKDDDKISGFITIGQKNDRADIGILAVDKYYRGQGIGRTLMKAAENYYFNKLRFIQVITQKENLLACKLYESCGYQTEKVEFVYHLWKKYNT